MDDFRVSAVTTDEGWDLAVPVLRDLWTDADESFVRLWRDEEQYHLFARYRPAEGREGRGDGGSGEAGLHEGDLREGCLREGDEVVGVVGVSVQRVLHHERHAWIHDLVVSESHRGEGHGAALVSFVSDWAHERDCEHVALAAVVDNDDAVGFYEAEGFDRFAYVFEREP